MLTLKILPVVVLSVTVNRFEVVPKTCKGIAPVKLAPLPTNEVADKIPVLGLTLILLVMPNPVSLVLSTKVRFWNALVASFSIERDAAAADEPCIP